MTKYRQAFQEMLARHKQEFEEFKEVHDLYKQDQAKWQEKFDERGKPLVRIVEETENRLCGKMEGSGKGNYSGGLAEKFRQEVRTYLPMIDFVGVKIS
jgi:hypothetical protein